MKAQFPRDVVRGMAWWSEAKQREALAAMTPAEVLAFDADFQAWADDGQIAPRSDGWRVWLMMAGRGYGKTRAGAEWVHALAMGRGKRIALVGATIDEARAVMVEGVSGLLSVARRDGVKLKWEPSQRTLTWPSGSVATLYSGDKADGLRGPENDYAWCDELAKWREGEAAWVNLQMGLRRGTRPRALVTTTPKVGPLLERIQADRWTVTTGGKTKDNISLPEQFVEVMMATYGGTRIGRQELDGELLGEAEGSLFPRALLERCRVGASSTAAGEAEYDRVVVGVDPPAGVGGDACGIVVAGRRDGICHVLADASVTGASPERWARAVAGTAEAWGASHVVAEANQGGAMVESVLKAADPSLKVRMVHASKGKVARAEPVAVRFEAGKAFLKGQFPELEAELSGLSAGGAYDGPGRSPDRADACVWALTELSETKSGVPRVRML